MDSGDDTQLQNRSGYLRTDAIVTSFHEDGEQPLGKLVPMV